MAVAVFFPTKKTTKGKILSATNKVRDTNMAGITGHPILFKNSPFFSEEAVLKRSCIHWIPCHLALNF